MSDYLDPKTGTFDTENYIAALRRATRRLRWRSRRERIIRFLARR